MSGGGVNVEENLNRLDELHIAAHLFHNVSEVFAGHVGTTKYNIKLKWLRTRLQQMPLDLDDNGLMQYARCYILYLLGGVLLPDKANNTVYVRYLPLLAEYDAIGTYSWGSAVLCWLYRAMCLATDYSNWMSFHQYLEDSDKPPTNRCFLCCDGKRVGHCNRHPVSQLPDFFFSNHSDMHQNQILQLLQRCLWWNHYPQWIIANECNTFCCMRDFTIWVYNHVNILRSHRNSKQILRPEIL
ncbi:hypothetical protein Ahy_A02g006463 [Arachis hypogaea]|uniref:Aminotransferase-like plant mobile domain-containing protein n=1 Tax=Arachis hypogaea TaxID=3818 RepID=A0A445E9W1_ARAHY|nr:hypothetical protein Ahy_A02g006463 [Arachis hypogaea]